MPKKPASNNGADVSPLIDAYIERLGDWRSQTLAKLRQAILSTSPEVTEAWKWDVPVWEANGIICVAGAFKGKVKLTFSKGASLQDPRKVFNAGLTGGTWRALDLKQGDKIDTVGLKALVKQAIAINTLSKK